MKKLVGLVVAGLMLSVGSSAMASTHHRHHVVKHHHKHHVVKHHHRHHVKPLIKPAK
jgi:hypothetical protein